MPPKKGEDPTTDLWRAIALLKPTESLEKRDERLYEVEHILNAGRKYNYNSEMSSFTSNAPDVEAKDSAGNNALMKLAARPCFEEDSVNAFYRKHRVHEKDDILDRTVDICVKITHVYLGGTERRAYLAEKNKAGKTALDIAIEHGNFPVIEGMFDEEHKIRGIYADVLEAGYNKLKDSLPPAYREKFEFLVDNAKEVANPSRGAGSSAAPKANTTGLVAVIGKVIDNYDTVPYINKVSFKGSNSGDKILRLSFEPEFDPFWVQIGPMVNKVITHGKISMFVKDDKTIHIHLPADVANKKAVREFIFTLMSAPEKTTIRDSSSANNTFFKTKTKINPKPSEESAAATASVVSKPAAITAVASKPAASAATTAVVSKPASTTAVASKPALTPDQQFLKGMIDGNFNEALKGMEAGADLLQLTQKDLYAVHYLGIHEPSDSQLEAYKTILRKYLETEPQHLEEESVDEDTTVSTSFRDYDTIDFAEHSKNATFINTMVDLLLEMSRGTRWLSTVHPGTHEYNYEFFYEKMKRLANRLAPEKDKYVAALRRTTCLPERTTLIGGRKTRRKHARKNKIKSFSLKRK